MSNNERTPSTNPNSSVEEQTPHSGKQGFEQPHREFDNTPLGTAPLDYDPRTEHELTTEHLPDDLRVVPSTPEKTKLGWKKPAAALALIAATAAGVYGGAKAFGGDSDKDPSNKGQGIEAIDEADRYVEYSFENRDRNNDGTPDGSTDVDGDGISDGDELWDQKNQEFVDPREGENDAALENASPEDLQDIEALSSIMDTSSNPYWRADFIALEPAVKRYLMIVYNRPENYESTMSWESAIITGFSYTTEDLERIADY